VIVFEEVASAMPPPIKIWFPPNALAGFEFRYLKAPVRVVAELASK
jgi:hypothetical protein